MMPKKREMGKEGMGSSGDMKDRMRGAYKPGANPAPKPGLRNPMDVIKGMMPKKPAKPDSVGRSYRPKKGRP